LLLECDVLIFVVTSCCLLESDVLRFVVHFLTGNKL
jgi:hypothetical protein